MIRILDIAMAYKKHISVFLGVLFSLFTASISAQTLQFRHLTNRDGLSHPYVRSIVQDKLGFMWFGTYDGLNKYDGYKFTVYRHVENDPSSIPSNTIITMCKDPQGNLLIGTTGGLSVYDDDRDIFVTYNEIGGFRLDSMLCSSILKDSKGNLWIGTAGQGLLLVDTLHNQITQYANDKNNPYSLSDNTVECLFEDNSHKLWIGTFNGGVNVFHDGTKTFTRYVHQENDPKSIIGNHVRSIAQDMQGNLWFVCIGEGISYIRGDQGDNPSFTYFQTDPQKPHSLADQSVYVLKTDNNDGLWAGSLIEGVYYLPKNKKELYHYKSNKDNPNSLNNSSIYSFCQDKSNDMWIGTYAGGVNVLHHTKQLFRHYYSTPGGSNQLNNNNVWKFAEDRKGTIWIATDGGGLNGFDPHSENFIHYNSKNSNLQRDAVLCVCVDGQDAVWIGTWAGGFSLLNEKTKSFTTFTHENSGLLNNNVLDIADGRDGTLWLATQGGLDRFDKRTQRLTAYPQVTSTVVYKQLEVVRVDSNGNILVGGPNGASILDPKKNTVLSYRHNSKDKNSLSNDMVTSFFEENRKILWISTTNGLNRLDRETQQITHYSTSDGLPNNLVYGVEKDTKGYLWISTNEGLSRFDPGTKSFNNFTREDGLQENIFIKKSHYKAKDGQLYFGGVNGFNVFNSDEVYKNTIIPPVVITDFQVFNKSVKPAVEHSPLKKSIIKADELVLSYQQNVFSFEYSALNYIASSKCQYAYMLDGFEKSWNYVGKRRSATYTNIDPGRYIFRVKASNDDGVWNEEGASIKIIITPPVWETSWFRIAGILCILGTIIAGYKGRTSRIRSRNRELERHVFERTAQLETANKELEAFSYSVSHDLRAPLRSIDGFSSAILEDYAHALDDKGKDYLRRVRAASQHMEQLIDDMLNLSRVMRTEMQRSLVDLSRLALLVSSELTRSQPERKVTWNIKPDMFALADRNLMQIVLDNLFGNAWKFTGKHPTATIEFGTMSKQGQTIFYVRDDGDGFDMAYATKLFGAFQRMHTPAEFQGTGIGLTTVRRIIHRHGGDIWAEAEKDKGATFYFTLP
jgi:two-component system, sensor histidine kinase ChiS